MERASTIKYNIFDESQRALKLLSTIPIAGITERQIILISLKGPI